MAEVVGTSVNGIAVSGSSETGDGVRGVSRTGPGVVGKGTPAGVFDGPVRVSGTLHTAELAATGTASAGHVSAAGNVDVGEFVNTNHIVAKGNISAVGNVNAGHVSAQGNISAVNNVNAKMVNATTISAQGDVNANGNINTLNTVNAAHVSAQGNISAVNNVNAKHVSAQGNISAVGNVNAGHVSAQGNISAVNNVNAKMVNATTISAQGDVNANGNINTLGNVNATNVHVAVDIILDNADCAEDFDLEDGSTTRPAPGTVVVLGNDGSVRVSRTAYDKRVAGVVSGGGKYRPGIILDRRSTGRARVPVALLGKVYCKADASFASIEVGDLLTTSANPGHAMKAGDPTRSFGSVIGKALRPLSEGQDLIPVLIALK